MIYNIIRSLIGQRDNFYGFIDNYVFTIDDSKLWVANEFMN